MGVRIYHQQVAQVLTVWLVGKIVPEPGPSTNISSYDPLGITQPTLSSTPSKTEHGATNEMGSPEPQSSPRLNWPQQNVSPSTQEVSIVVNPSIRERAPHPPPGESYEGADSVQPRENWNITVSTFPPYLWYVNNIPLIDPSNNFTSSTSCKSRKLE